MWCIQASKQARKHTHAQCSHVSVGLTQAHANNIIRDCTQERLVQSEIMIELHCVPTSVSLLSLLPPDIILCLLVSLHSSSDQAMSAVILLNRGWFPEAAMTRGWLMEAQIRLCLRWPASHCTHVMVNHFLLSASNSISTSWSHTCTTVDRITKCYRDPIPHYTIICLLPAQQSWYNLCHIEDATIRTIQDSYVCMCTPSPTL